MFLFAAATPCLAVIFSAFSFLPGPAWLVAKAKKLMSASGPTLFYLQSFYLVFSVVSDRV